METGAAIAGCLECLEDHICVVASGPPMQEQGASFQEMCSAFEGLAIFYLLDDLNFTRYHWNLQRSAQARLFFLRKLREQEAVDCLYAALSRTDSVFAAIATDDFVSAGRLQDLAAPAWLPNGEYEDDYWYFRIVHAVVKDALPEATEHLTRFETALEGRADQRLELCRTFLQKSQPEFWVAFGEFVGVRQRSSAIDHDDGRLVEEPWRAAVSHVSTEAVAWHKLALAQGFSPPELEYPLCPSLALRPPTGERSPDIFQQLELQFGL